MSAPINAPSFAVRTANIHEADAARAIDAFVRGSDKGSPFHLTAWSRAITKACGHKSHYLVAEDGDGVIAGVLPLTEIRSMLFGRAMVSAGFAVDGGILADSEIAAIALAETAVALAKDAGCPSIEMRGGAAPASWPLDTDSYVGFSRALAADDEAELLAIPRKQRAEVRRALGHELVVETGSSKADRDAHFHVYATSVRNLGTPVFPKKLFAAVLSEFGADADILTIRQRGTPIASVLSLYHNGVVMPYWGGGTADARVWRANDLMYYALMLHARTKKGCTRFDFGRSKVGTGAASFKKNWGFEPEPLSYAKWVADGHKAREINPLNPKYQMQVAVWKKLPLWLANQMGPFIAKGLG
jgi:FemAB-related protein (PEP-CTERM system-associated)